VTIVSGSRLLALGACIAALGCAVGCASGPDDPAERSAQIVFGDLNPALLSVSGTAADDVYAVGADPGDGLGPYVLHYNGRGWRRLDTGTAGELWWISVEMIDGSFYMAGSEGKVLQYNPSSDEFEVTYLPDGLTMFGVWGTGRDDLWAVGGDLENGDTGGAIWHFDGNAWTLEDVSEAAPEGLPTLFKVWGRSRDDVYAVGRQGRALHFDGERWTPVETDTAGPFFTVHGNATEVVASGGTGAAIISELSDGAFVNRAAAGTFRMSGVFIPQEGPGVCVGNETSMALRTPDGWELLDTGLDMQRDLHAVWVDPAGGIWAVGGNLSATLDSGILVYVGSDDIGTDVIRGTE
jgi:hypothetical protein